MVLLLLAFFLSGIAGLVYEIAWMRSLELVFGGSTPAVSTVLAAFMGGLALGSGILGRRFDRMKLRPLTLYGYLEAGIAVAALIVPLGLGLSSALYRASYGVEGPGFGAGILRFALVFIVLVIPTMLMGATFPAIVRAYDEERRERVSSRSIAWLYGWNTLGAVIGVGLAGFVLLRLFGTTVTLACAAALNLAAAALALLLSRARRERQAVSPSAARSPVAWASPAHSTPAHDRIPVRAYVAAAFLAGFAALACEVVWSRVLKLVLASSIFSVSTMLMAFLSGIAIGSLVISARKRISPRAIPLLLLGLGAAMAIAIPLIFESSRLFSGISRVVAGGRAQTWGAILSARFLLAAAIMFVPAALSGALFPCLVHRVAEARRDSRAIGGPVGLVYASNTVGGVLGSLGAGFVLIPLLGTQGAVLLAAVLLILMAAYLLHRAHAPREAPFSYALLVAAAIVCIVAGVARGGDHFLGKLSKGPDTRTLRYEEGVGATVIVVQQGAQGELCLYTNGTFAVDTSPESQQAVAFLGHVPALFDERAIAGGAGSAASIPPSPGPARGASSAPSALVIGFGMGCTLAAVASHDYADITCVEIVPGVIDAAPMFAEYNSEVYRDPRVRFVVEDGRSYLAGSGRIFDLITCDPIHPAFGSPALYTREYFELCRAHLSPDGVIAQYLPLHQLAPEDFRLLLRTVANVFPHCAVFLAVSHGVIIGSPAPLALDLAALDRIFSAASDAEAARRGPVAGELLARAGIASSAKLLSCLALDSRGVAALAGSGPLNTDDHPVLEFSESRSYGKDTRSANLAAFLAIEPDPESLLAAQAAPLDAGFSRALGQAVQGRRHLLASLLAHGRGDDAKALEEIRLADQAWPDDPDIVGLGGDALGYAYFVYAQRLFDSWRKVAPGQAASAGAAESDKLDAAEAAILRARTILPANAEVAALWKAIQAGKRESEQQSLR
ncbi:MAG: fused MFS/spermidine synthase [Candidatus Eisenbacteria bacterium]|nr:fused MFS/spermidine synthase [Candidatus Eisenbacteria bacterium]